MAKESKKKGNYGRIEPRKKTTKSGKLSDKAKMMADKTDSKIPKTPREKKMWIQARRLVAKKTGDYSEKDQPWGLTTTIYKKEKKANKIIRPRDIERAKVSKTVRAYKKPDKKKR